MRRYLISATIALLTTTAAAQAEEWVQFRGPGGLGISEQKNLPVHWSSTENVAWKTELPGPGTSSPIVVGDRVYLTCYSGYGLEAGEGDMNDLMRHLVCIDRKSGQIVWHKQYQPQLPEHQYQGNGARHGYSSSTPTSDGEHLYVFFGKSGVYCFDLDGNQIWHTSVGDGINGWGSSNSPVLYGDLLIVNASVESGAMVALNKMTGEEVWRTPGMRASWNTPIIVEANSEPELVVSIQSQVLGLSPETGEELWRSKGVERYVCPSVVAHDGIIYAIGGGHTTLAVRAGGRGDVSETHGVWYDTGTGSNVPSPVYHEGHLYWARESGLVMCQDVSTGEFLYRERLAPGSGTIYASPILADGKLYVVSQHNGTYVVAAKPEFELVAHNVFEDDSSRSNASPAVSHGRLLLRSDRYLYAIGQASN